MIQYPKRLIEVDLPIRRISAHARREKNVRSGHLASLHIWWARRPLAACRAVLCAALWPDPADDRCPQAFRTAAAEQMARLRDRRGGPVRDWQSREELRLALLDFIADFADWDNSADREMMGVAQALTHSAHLAMGDSSGSKPLVMDPFAGGGAIPLEALRVGADAFAGDLNPVAALLNTVALTHAPRYGTQLADEVERWGQWVATEARRELERFYPRRGTGTPFTYFWARTIRCEGPGCGVEVPILRSQILSTRGGVNAAVVIEYPEGKLQTRVVLGRAAKGISGGTSKRSSATCPNCGFTTPRKRVEAQANERGFGLHLYAIATRDASGRREFLQPDEEDLRVLAAASAELAIWRDRTFDGVPAIPNEELPYLRSIFNVRVYGIDQWRKLFTDRQLLSALTHTSVLRNAAKEIERAYADKSFATAVTECVALSVSNALQYQCNIATWLSEGVTSAFIQGQSLPMKMDFVEANPLVPEVCGGYDFALQKHLSGLRYLGSFPLTEGAAQQVSALASPLPDDSCDLLVTDPPYYDVVPYADCSDFFYVWLRRMLGGRSTSATDGELTPKDEEIVQLAERNERYRQKTKRWFEQRMCDALAEGRRNVRPEGVAVIVFAHKDTAAWEALLQSVLSAGWVVTGSWPIDTERASRMRANESAVLGSSIHLVCRPREWADGSLAGDEVGDWREVLAELPLRMHDWMPRLASEGVVGADAIFACLGPALEVFSRYSRVEKANGDLVSLPEYLEHVWAAVANEALSTIFEGADAAGLEPDARLTAMWLWTLGLDGGRDDSEGEGDQAGRDEGVPGATGGVSLSMPFDAARKIAQGLGADLEAMGGVIELSGETARLLSVMERGRWLFRRKGDADAVSLETRSKRQSSQGSLFAEGALAVREPGVGSDAEQVEGKTTLDRVHQAMLLFASGRTDALRGHLVENGAGLDIRFWRLAQALSVLYPSSTNEKRWVDGVLARKKSLGF